VAQPTAAQLEASGLAKLPLAPDSKRVDLATSPFTDPTREAEVDKDLAAVSEAARRLRASAARLSSSVEPVQEPCLKLISSDRSEPPETVISSTTPTPRA
jgi:hypothetical protein